MPDILHKGPGMKIIIRRANEKTIDFAVDYSLRCDYPNYTREQFLKIRKIYIERLKKYDYNCFIAFFNKTPVGYIDIEKRDYDFKQKIWINEVYVRKDYCGKGIGTQLKAFIEKPVRKLGFEEIYTATEPGNKASLKLLKKSGYKPVRYIFQKKLRRFGRKKSKECRIGNEKRCHPRPP